MSHTDPATKQQSGELWAALYAWEQFAGQMFFEPVTGPPGLKCRQCGAVRRGASSWRELTHWPPCPLLVVPSLPIAPCAHSWQWAKTSAPCEPAELVQVCALCGAEKEEE